MREAIKLSLNNAKKAEGPFGSVIVKNNKIISKGVNKVVSKKDPTAHAEIEAIRSASKKLNTFDLSGCEIYSSCEPCPMCLSAIYWARIDKIYFGNTKKDAAKIGFIDDFIYKEFERPIIKRKLKTGQFLRDEALMAFEVWDMNSKKVKY